MILRTTILVVAAALFVASLAGAAVAPGLWPFVVYTLVLVIGTWFERRRYGAAQDRPAGQGWHATGERFVDDATGRPITVWFNPNTGERRYVEDNNSFNDTANQSHN